MVEYSLDSGTTGILGVYDSRGRSLTEEVIVGDGQRTGFWSWDGVDDNGRNAASGIYYIRLGNGGMFETAKVTLVR